MVGGGGGVMPFNVGGNAVGDDWTVQIYTMAAQNSAVAPGIVVALLFFSLPLRHLSECISENIRHGCPTCMLVG